MPDPEKLPHKPTPPITWECERCDSPNDDQLEICEICGTLRETGEETVGEINTMVQVIAKFDGDFPNV
jgi:hypothetical protein